MSRRYVRQRKKPTVRSLPAGRPTHSCHRLPLATLQASTMAEDRGGSADLISKEKFHDMIRMLDQDGDGTVTKVRVASTTHWLLRGCNPRRRAALPGLGSQMPGSAHAWIAFVLMANPPADPHRWYALVAPLRRQRGSDRLPQAPCAAAVPACSHVPSTVCVCVRVCLRPPLPRLFAGRVQAGVRQASRYERWF